MGHITSGPEKFPGRSSRYFFPDRKSRSRPGIIARAIDGLVVSAGARLKARLTSCLWIHPPPVAVPRGRACTYVCTGCSARHMDVRGSPLTGPPLPTSGVVRIVVVPPPPLSRQPLSLSLSVSSSRVIPPVVMVTHGLEPPPAANQSSRPG